LKSQSCWDKENKLALYCITNNSTRISCYSTYGYSFWAGIDMFKRQNNNSSISFLNNHHDARCWMSRLQLAKLTAPSISLNVLFPSLNGTGCDCITTPCLWCLGFPQQGPERPRIRNIRGPSNCFKLQEFPSPNSDRPKSPRFLTYSLSSPFRLFALSMMPLSPSPLDP
jgi:hypothetical protein